MLKLLPAPPIPVARPDLIGLFLFFCAGFADGAMVPFFPLWAKGEAGIATGYIGLLFGCYAGGELLATPFLGGIADRIGRRPVLILSACGVGSGFLALYFAHGVIAAAVILIATGIFESVLHPTVLMVIADTTPPEATGGTSAWPGSVRTPDACRGLRWGCCWRSFRSIGSSSPAARCCWLAA